MALTDGVSKRDGSDVVATDKRIRIPMSTKRAGMSTMYAHIFLSRLKVSSRFFVSAIRCAPNSDLERSMPRSLLLAALVGLADCV